MVVKVLALDLERTLISDARSAEPRPGLFEFLVFCQERFARVVLFTTVEESDAREVLEGLAQNGDVPPGFLTNLDYIEWSGEYKDLRFIPDAVAGDVLLVDDDGGWVHPNQRDRWVPIEAWDGGPDDELRRVRAVLENWLEDRATGNGNE